MNFFLYARKSTDEDDRQMLSIESQLDELRELAKKDGIQIVREFVESMSAKAPGRPAFRRADPRSPHLNHICPNYYLTTPPPRCKFIA